MTAPTTTRPTRRKRKVVAPPPEPIEVAKAWLTEHRACEACQHPVNDQGLGEARGWIHTVTGQYRCPEGSGYATPMAGEDAIAAAVDAAIAETESVLRETLYDDGEMDTARDDANDAGRAEYSTELNGAITAALHNFRAGLTDAENDVVNRLNEALTEAWLSVPV